MTHSLDVTRARASFPSLDSEWTFLDNAGGSPCLASVADRVRSYLLETNVQLGATYAPSVESGERVAAGVTAVADLLGAGSPDEVVVGPSTTQLMMNFAASFGAWLEPGDRVVVTDLDHEANIGPWRRLQGRGIEIAEWRAREGTWELELEDLEPLLGPRTKLVCFTATSNVIGSVAPVTRFVERIHEHGALACIDAVAYAPHRLIDATGWGADIVAFSLYKTYGPHVAAARVEPTLLRRLPKVNHYFVGDDAGPSKFQPGNVNYELTWASGAIVDYLEGVGGSVADDAAPRRDRLAAAFEVIAAHEERLADRLLGFLRTRGGVTIHGRHSAAAQERVPTISFTAEGRSSRSIVEHLDGRKLGARHGHFYARRLLERMGLDPDDGVVRVSLIHLNTVEEVDRLVAALEEVL